MTTTTPPHRSRGSRREMAMDGVVAVMASDLCRGRGGLAAPTAACSWQEVLDDDLRGHEKEDHALDDADDVDRDLGRSLHRARAGAHDPEQERPTDDPERVRPPEQRDGDAVEAVV